MRMKNLALISAFAISTFPLAALADIHILNNTEQAMTGSVRGTCSSSIGEILKPHQPLTITKFQMNMICGFSHECSGDVFASDNCASSHKIATVTVDPNKGITNIVNYNVDGYIVNRTGDSSVTIDNKPARKWYQLFF